jgi:hypothetical protein
VEAAQSIHWRPLGQLFVEKGLLTEERLEHALAEQAATGGRLGEKLVELGYVSSSSLARLLAEQYGVELSYDTGFGTGLRAELERRYEKENGPEVEATEEQPVLKITEPGPDGGDALRPLGGLEEQWAKLAAAEARVAEVESELEDMRRKFADSQFGAGELADELRAQDDDPRSKKLRARAASRLTNGNKRD